MDQMSFGDAEYAAKKKATRRELFLAEVDKVVPWDSLLKVIEPFYPLAGRGRRPYPVQVVVRVHLMQNWFGLSDPAMEESLYEISSMRKFAKLTLQAIPDETTILNFRRLIETNDLAPMIFDRVNALLTRKGLMLKRGSIVDATIIPAPSSTKNADRQRDPEMHQTKKGNQCYFGMQAHIGVDTDSGLVHTVVTRAANEADIEVVDELLHGKEKVVHADAGYTGADKRVVRKTLTWKIAAKRGRLKAMPEGKEKDRLQVIETAKARIRARVEHPFRVLKRQFGFAKARFRGLTKNTAQLMMLFALSNLWMVRKQRLDPAGKLRAKYA